MYNKIIQKYPELKDASHILLTGKIVKALFDSGVSLTSNDLYDKIKLLIDKRMIMVRTKKKKLNRSFIRFPDESFNLKSWIKNYLRLNKKYFHISKEMRSITVKTNKQWKRLIHVYKLKE